MRACRVLYVEDDPALRGVVGSLLWARPDLELVRVAESAIAALADLPAVDVALLDLHLGDEQLNGVELGLLLRRQQPDVGVVIFTQHILSTVPLAIPERERMGWSVVEKRADLDLDALVRTMRDTAAGHSITEPTLLRTVGEGVGADFAALSAPQLQLLALLSHGHDTGAIAQFLGMTPASVRKDLSRAYAAVVPDAGEGADVRTVAVLRYLRHTRRLRRESPDGAVLS